LESKGKGKMTSIYVEAREWFDKTGGNSYFAGRVSVDGDLIGFLPFQYGYGSQFEYAAGKVLADKGYITEAEANEPLFMLKRKGVAVYTVKYETKKADAKRFGLMA
jgi:hypothetical protein